MGYAPIGDVSLPVTAKAINFGQIQAGPLVPQTRSASPCGFFGICAALFAEPKASSPIIGLAIREEKEEFPSVKDVNLTTWGKEKILDNQN